MDQDKQKSNIEDGKYDIDLTHKQFLEIKKMNYNNETILV